MAAATPPAIVPGAPALPPTEPPSPEVTAQLPAPPSTATPTTLSVTTPSRAVAPPADDDNATRLQTEGFLPESNGPPLTEREAEGGEGVESRFGQGVHPGTTLVPPPFKGVATVPPANHTDVLKEEAPPLIEQPTTSPPSFDIPILTPSDVPAPPEAPAEPGGTLTEPPTLPSPAGPNEVTGSNQGGTALPPLGEAETVYMGGGNGSSNSSAKLPVLPTSPHPQDLDSSYQHDPADSPLLVSPSPGQCPLFKYRDHPPLPKFCSSSSSSPH